MQRSAAASFTLFLLAIACALPTGAGPLSNPQPASNVLVPGTTSVALAVSSTSPTTCAYSVGTNLPYAQMMTFAQGAGTTSHHTTIALNTDPRVVNHVYLRCAAQPDSVLQVDYRVRADVHPSYPRVGVLWGWGRWTYEENRSLADRARVDLWLGADLYAPSQLPGMQSDFQQLRGLNPNVLFLLSMNAVEPYTAAIPESYYLHDVHGQRIEVWPGSYRLNLTRPEVAAFQAQWAYSKMAESGFVHDGVFVDNVFLSQSWQTTDIYGNPVQIDANGDGIADAAATLDAAWRAGVLAEVEGIRALMPGILMSGHALDETEPRILATFNGGSTGFLPADVIEDQRSFSSADAHESAWASQARAPQLNMLEGSPIDLFAYGYDYDPLSHARPAGITFAQGYGPWMRFALGLALMHDDYVTYEWGDTDHGQSWWYDEYDFDLGAPSGAATTVPVAGFDPGSNLIVNPGFESPLAYPWSSWVAAGYAATFALDPVNPHAGAAAARINVTQSAGINSQVEFRQDARTLVAGTEYEVTFWARASSARSMDLATLQNVDPWSDYGLRTSVTLGPAWQKYTLDFTAKRSGSDARLQFMVGATTGTVWIDDVQVVRAAPAVMRRDFANGIVLLNGTAVPRTIVLGPGYRRLASAQAPRVQAIVDDSVSTFATPSGTWTHRALDSGTWKAAGPFFHSFGDSLRFLVAGPGEARWKLPAAAADTYSVSVWYPAAPESASWSANVRYDVLVNGAVAGGRTLGQNAGGDQWQPVARVPVPANADVQLRLTCASGACVADAVLLESASRYNDGSAADAVALGAHDAIVLRRDPSAGVTPRTPALALAVAPNPAREQVRFTFELPASGLVTLRVYDVAGREVAEVLRGMRPAGPQAVAWDARGRGRRGAAPGVYLARLEFGGTRAVRRFALVP